MRRLVVLLLALALVFFGAGAEILVEDGAALMDDGRGDELIYVEFGEDYYNREEVSLYLHVFCQLPPNYITKKEAEALGWRSYLGNLWEVAEGFVIGGDRFGNREGLLPKAPGRSWYECDVDYEGGFRGTFRLLFSSDGLIYFTSDHYASFECLYEGWYMDGLYGEEYDDAA